MKSIRNLLIGLAVLVVLLLSTVTYRVRFNETAILTTFGKADEASVINEAGDEAGLKFKWPWPVQDVTRSYSRGVLVLEDTPEQATTRDRQTVIAQTYVAWRVSDPLAFYKSLSTVPRAEQRIRDQLRAARGIIGEYRFGQLINTDPDRLARDELEARMAQRIEADLADEGVEVVAVGLKRVGLSQNVSLAVIERMRRTSERQAGQATAEGEAQAATIRNTAQTQAEKIMAFAEREAATLRAEGDRRAAQYLSEFSQDEELAVLLQQLEQIPQLLNENTTIFLDPNNPIFRDFAPLRPDFDPNAPQAAADEEDAR